KKKTLKKQYVKKISLPRSAKTTCNPVEIQYSCGFREDHLSENSAYVPHSATALLPLPRPLTR
ncbi:TPA: hypothetical protein ACWB97_005338, partial [Escherichia coli]